ncbi:hypothetical protein ACWCPJ_03140 [Streptomyces collinus]|uniref:hypothetical protein n=1 Tax=Streptomyces collinus TaxID=42684 RepID=UPI003674180A
MPPGAARHDLDPRTRPPGRIVPLEATSPGRSTTPVTDEGHLSTTVRQAMRLI